MKACLRNLIPLVILTVPVLGYATASEPTQTSQPASESQTVEAPIPSYPVEQSEMSDGGASMLKAIGGMGLVVCLMIGAFFAAKKFAPRYFSKGSTEKNLKVIETLSMGDKRSISMISVGNSRLLVSNTASQISLLMALPDPGSPVSEPETLQEAPKPPSKKDSAVPFRNLFEVEKKRPVQRATHPLPDDIRTKMRQLREALER